MDIEAKVITFYYDLERRTVKMFSSRENMKIHIEENWVRIEKADERVIMVNTDSVKYYTIED